jgi:DNA-binding response OmpR family regulator
MEEKTILLIEDDANIANYIQYRLSRNGYDVDHRDNGIDGLDAIKSEQPDLVILDMMMPGMDGREVTEIVHEEHLMDPGRIIILSGKEETDEIRALFNMGIHDYLQKPFNIDNLVVRIDRALSLQEADA